MRYRPAGAWLMLTKSQRRLFDFIVKYTDENNDMAPTFQEMTTGIGHLSKSHVHRLLGALEERGFIRRIPNRARAIEVLKRLDSDNPVELARLHLASAKRALEGVEKGVHAAHLDVVLALIAIKTAIEHLGPGKGEAT
jgi:SOS-response transcriptional repressor LexA